MRTTKSFCNEVNNEIYPRLNENLYKIKGWQTNVIKRFNQVYRVPNIEFNKSYFVNFNDLIFSKYTEKYKTDLPSAIVEIMVTDVQIDYGGFYSSIHLSFIYGNNRKGCICIGYDYCGKQTIGFRFEPFDNYTLEYVGTIGTQLTNSGISETNAFMVKGELVDYSTLKNDTITAKLTSCFYNVVEDVDGTKYITTCKWDGSNASAYMPKIALVNSIKIDPNGLSILTYDKNGKRHKFMPINCAYEEDVYPDADSCINNNTLQVTRIGGAVEHYKPQVNAKKAVVSVTIDNKQISKEINLDDIMFSIFIKEYFQ